MGQNDDVEEQGKDSALTDLREKKTDAERIARLKRQAAEIRARIAALENRGKEQDRKNDTRLKIIVGGALLADAAIHPESAQFMEALLTRAVVTDRDKDFLAAMFAKRSAKL